MFDGVVCAGDAVNVDSVEYEVCLVVLRWLHVVGGKEKVFSGCWEVLLVQNIACGDGDGGAVVRRSHTTINRTKSTTTT